jgi:hypothetical protein
MQPGPEDPSTRLSSAARGWHGIQMALLGFIGFCGVLRDGGSAPSWLQWVAAILAGLALVFAAGAIYNVGRVAYPFYGGTVHHFDGQQQLESAGSRLRRGIQMTFLSGAAVAIAAVSGWWPGAGGTAAAASTASATVEVRDESGRGFCGQLVEAPQGAVRLDTAQGVITLPLGTVATITPVSGC